MAEQDEPKQAQPTGDDDFTDPETDSAVDDITRTEGDDELRAQNAVAGRAAVPMRGGGRFRQAWRGWWASPRKKWGTVTAVVIAAALFAVPVTRYNVLGVALKTDVTVQAVDSRTGAPVSSAVVELSGQTAETQADGKATLRVKLGSGVLTVSKRYYDTYSHSELAGSGGNSFRVKLAALGRQVQVKVVNKITDKPLAGAVVTASGASARTDANGLATVVLPSGANTQSATVTLGGYNDGKVTIDANGDLAKDTFAVTPAGKLYFLSNLSGTIDVVKTNLDGTGRQTVLAGTGNEDPGSTSLLASRDWKYLALLARRAGDTAGIYLIDTTNGDKLTTVDASDAVLNLVGWSDDRLIYTVDRSSTVANWQSDQEMLKSFDPATGNTLLLDQTQASGTDESDYAKQVISDVYLMNNQIVYTKTWQGYNTDGSSDVLSGKQAELDVISADGSGHRTLKSFAPASSPDGAGYVSVDLNARLYEPDNLYVDFNDNGTDNFYAYDGSGVTPADVSADDFYNASYPTFLLSPSGGQTFWADQRDGKNTLFTGGENAQNQKQVAALSDYSPYGWYTDNYLLVSKNSSELYIMPASGGTPLKITDYYKPAINYQGYGGGYGGL